MFVGITMVLMQLGSRHVMSDISDGQQKLLGTELVKKAVVFCMFFVPTRDVMIAMMLTFAFFFVTGEVLNEKKNYSLVGSVQSVQSEEGYVNANGLAPESRSNLDPKEVSTKKYNTYLDAVAMRRAMFTTTSLG